MGERYQQVGTAKGPLMLHFYLISCVQIVLESFPVSSSGHCLLLQNFFSDFFSSKLSDGHGMCVVTVKTFFNNELVTHFLHGPTVFVLAFFFFNQWKKFLLHPFKYRYVLLKLALFVMLADIATAMFYFIFKVFDFSFFPVWAGFLLSACVLFSLCFIKDKQQKVITWKTAVILGLVQGVAFLPGVSRLGIVFVVSRWLGLSRKKSFEISFLIFWPLIAVAFLNSITIRALYADLCVWHVLFNVRTIFVFAVASVVAFFALWFVWWLVQKKKMWIFSVYLLLPIVVWFFV